MVFYILFTTRAKPNAFLLNGTTRTRCDAFVTLCGRRGYDLEAHSNALRCRLLEAAAIYDPVNSQSPD
jgi:hypothetical protein